MKKIIQKVLIAGALYSAAENLLMLKTRHERLGKGICVVHISDLHKRKFGRDNRYLCKIIKRENPDLILITGDLVTRDCSDFTTAGLTLKRLCSIAPVFMIEGNHEQSIAPENKVKYYSMLRETDIILLKNSYSDVKFEDRKIRIYGLCEPYSTYKKNGGYFGLDSVTADDLDRYLGRCSGGEVWLMAHNPLHGRIYAEWGANYTFSGHVHGGAVRLFGHGILSPERKFFPEFSKGIYTIGRMKLLVSAGLGKLRLFNPPEIVTYYI
ncbi:MAG: metallophosphoesterase [Ruminococcus sp.]|nr:metallophosphoesterase [Ruminococcus sp.]